MKRRVVVTGLGAVTPIGNTTDEFWKGIKEGKVGIGPITKFDTTAYKVKIAAEVKGFIAKERMDFKAAKRMELFSQYAVAAAKEAFDDTSLTALSTTEDPLRASIPFDKDRNGFVLGEGAGIVVLEELEHAKARGAKIHAELVGYGATGDAYHITSPAEDGSGAAKAMMLAMEEGGIEPSQVDYINAHGTSTHHNDLFETKAIKLALKDATKDVVVNSTKSMIGHLLGAAGGVEFIVCVKSIEENYIHQTVGTETPDEECDLNYAIGTPVQKDVNYVLTNSLGFGGHNATLLLKKYEG